MQLKTELWEHQKKAVEFSRTHKDMALFYEMGTGKTLTQIAILARMCEEKKRIPRTLIFCPLVVVPNWKKEFIVHSNTKPCTISLLQGPQKKRILWFCSGYSKIYVSNYESLRMKDLFKEYEKWQPEVIIFDESHKIKTHNTKRTKAAIKLAEKAEHVYLLSGTPVLNSPMDLFSQYRAMDKGKTFGKNFFEFRAMYFYDKNAYMPRDRHFPDWVVKPDAMEKMNRAINSTSLRVTKKQCLDLPPLVKQTQLVEMTPEQARLYKSMKRDLIAFLESSTAPVVAEFAMTKALRLMQIVSGFVKTTEGKEITLKATPREQALSELLAELTPNHKVIIWAVFKHNFRQIASICEKLEIDYVEVHGGITAKDKEQAISRFNSDRTARVFIGHPGAGGVGINLTVSDYSIYFSRGFSLEHDMQSEARNHRGGSEQHEKITRIDLVCPETIDELVLKMLAKKEAIGEKLLTALRG